MKDKGHFLISIIKSLFRITACILFLTNTVTFGWFAILFLSAELLGIAEELADKR